MNTYGIGLSETMNFMNDTDGHRDDHLIQIDTNHEFLYDHLHEFVSERFEDDPGRFHCILVLLDDLTGNINKMTEILSLICMDMDSILILSLGEIYLDI